MTTKEKNDLEYNDGLGDLLREKEYRRFSWIKTIGVLLAFVAVVLIFVVLVFDFGKSVIIKDVIVSDHLEAKADIPSKKDTATQENKQIALENENEIERITVATDSLISKISENEDIAKEIKDSAPKSNHTVPPQYKVIAGAFSNYENAKHQVQVLDKKNIKSFIWKRESNNTYLFLVQVGAFKTEAKAKDLIKQLNALGIESHITVK